MALARPIQAAPLADSAPQAPLVAERSLVERTMPATPAAQPTPAVQRAPVAAPSDVRAMVEASTGADLDGVPVHRGPEVAATASELSARAYTTGGEVHLPDEHGPLNGGPARALLAHELTHVAQQRALGSTLPPEDSVAGAQLEADAVQNERGAVEHGTQLSPMRAAPGTVAPPISGLSQPAPEAAARPPGVDLPLAPQRAPLSTTAADPARAAVAAGVAAPGTDGSIHFAPPGQQAAVVPSTVGWSGRAARHRGGAGRFLGRRRRRRRRGRRRRRQGAGARRAGQATLATSARTAAR